MIKAYEYLFYKLYQWSTKVNGKGYYHKYSASLMMAFVLMTNTFTVPPIITILTGNIVMFPNVPILTWCLIPLIYATFTYMYFSHQNRYLNVLDRYNDEDLNSRKQGNIIVVIYVIGSFLLLVVSWFLGLYIRGK